MRTARSLTASLSIGGGHACLGVCMAGGVCGRRRVRQGCMCWGACMAGGMCGRGVCEAGGVGGHARQGACVAHTHTPVDRMTDMCKNITLPLL